METEKNIQKLTELPDGSGYTLKLPIELFTSCGLDVNQELTITVDTDNNRIIVTK